jgi:RND family efflux transporter MFP subunit
MTGKIVAMIKLDAISNDNGSSTSFPRRGWMIGLGLMLLLALTGTACHQMLQPANGQPTSPQSHAALAVTTATPRRVTWPDVLVAQGAIAPWEEASIGTQIGSYQLIEVRVNVGDQVKRGQVLARLNPALLQAEERQLLARNAQAEANDRRARGLREAGGISDQDALQFATEARTAAALLAAKRLELQYTHIVAPDDGVISARTATTGAVVPAGQELFRLIRKNRLEWRGELTAEQIRTARRDQIVALDLPDGSDARARIREFAPTLDARSRLGIVYADILPASRARAGMYANGMITVGQSPAVVVPAECVVIRDGRSYVMVLSSAGQTSSVTLRAVTTKRRNGDGVEIIGGLTGKERLVRRGAAFLDDGDVVDVQDAGKARP